MGPQMTRRGWQWRDTARVGGALAGLVVLLALTIGARGQADDSTEADGAGHRAAMGSILQSLQVLTGASASLARFSAPEREARVVSALSELADQASMLAEHAAAADDDEEFLASALERYAAWTSRAYERGEHARALSMLRQLTDLCVSCHTRQRAAASSVVAREFVNADELSSLDARERARLQVATRQFDEALATMEAALPDTRPGDPRLITDLTTYVVVAVRVLDDAARALRLVERMLARGDLPGALRADLSEWRTALRELVARPPAITLEAAGALLARGEALNAATDGVAPGHAGVVQLVAASSLAQRVLDAGGLSPAGYAQGYLVVGMSELRLDPFGWIPRAELHLEQSIRAAPGTPTAQRAFEQLNARLSQTYAAQPNRIPPEVAEHLQRLRVLARTGREPQS
jgi:tetratricopeptide (TPR) repeat protein